jgi:hypothetical protein
MGVFQMRHKHADFIHKWADGAELQRYDAIMCRWADDKNPKWLEGSRYRVKPEPKPDVVVQFHAVDYQVYWAMYFDRIPNLKLTFDGETGELKAAEVMK